MTAIRDGEVGLTGRGILSRPDGATISYSRLEGKNPGVVFLHGYRSDMSGSKALALEDLCRARGQAFLRFDAFGHGDSSGDVFDGTIGRWAADAVAVIEALTSGPHHDHPCRDALASAGRDDPVALWRSAAALARPDPARDLA